MNMASFFQSPSSTSPLEVRQQQKALQVSDQNNTDWLPSEHFSSSATLFTHLTSAALKQIDYCNSREPSSHRILALAKINVSEGFTIVLAFKLHLLAPARGPFSSRIP